MWAAGAPAGIMAGWGLTQLPGSLARRIHMDHAIAWANAAHAPAFVVSDRVWAFALIALIALGAAMFLLGFVLAPRVEWCKNKRSPRVAQGARREGPPFRKCPETNLFSRKTGRPRKESPSWIAE